MTAGAVSAEAPAVAPSAAASAASRCAGGSLPAEEPVEESGAGGLVDSGLSSVIRSGGLLMRHLFRRRRRARRRRCGLCRADEIFAVRAAESPIAAARLAARIVIAVA